MAEMTDAEWADAVAADAANDGCDTGPRGSTPAHYRRARTIRNRDGDVVLQNVIDLRTAGFTGEDDGEDNTL